MSKNETKALTKRADDYSQWYLDVIEQAGLAEHSPVRGCMVIKPYGYAIWENIQRELDTRFKAKGVENAYFPLFIPESFLKKEAEHVEGFSPELAVVTHAGGEKLDEPLVVRPTSETIMYATFAHWIQSYRDLPLLINQWCNVVRWELRPRLFLRTTEFLWQEGHTCHTTENEADGFARQMLEVYREFAEDLMALPVITGLKSDAERFAGAVRTYSIEAMMQDGKALQAGTSHLLGQNFARAFEVKFLNAEGREEYVWQTSWGVSTRLIGGLIMAHSDDKGLVLPPRLAPIQTVIIPIGATPEELEATQAKATELSELLKAEGVSVKIDTREMRPGAKFFDWEKKGVPLRLELGPKDLAANSLVVVRRDTSAKSTVSEEELVDSVKDLLEQIQRDLFQAALARREANTHDVDSYDELKKAVETGFARAFWCGSAECETKIKDETKATIRSIPFDQKAENGKCVICGKKSSGRVVFAKAY